MLNLLAVMIAYNGTDVGQNGDVINEWAEFI